MPKKGFDEALEAGDLDKAFDLLLGQADLTLIEPSHVEDKRNHRTIKRRPRFSLTKDIESDGKNNSSSNEQIRTTGIVLHEVIESGVANREMQRGRTLAQILPTLSKNKRDFYQQCITAATKRGEFDPAEAARSAPFLINQDAKLDRADGRKAKHKGYVGMLIPSKTTKPGVNHRQIAEMAGPIIDSMTSDPDFKGVKIEYKAAFNFSIGATIVHIFDFLLNNGEAKDLKLANPKNIPPETIARQTFHRSWFSKAASGKGKMLEDIWGEEDTRGKVFLPEKDMEQVPIPTGHQTVLIYANQNGLNGYEAEVEFDRSTSEQYKKDLLQTVRRKLGL